MKTYNQIINENSENFQSGVEMWNLKNNNPEAQLQLLHVSKSSIREEMARMAKAFFLGENYDTIILEEYCGIFYASGENEKSL